MRTCLALLLVLLAGCDPAPPKATKLEESRTNATGDRKGLGDCLTACEGDKKLSPTDLATCRLNCETAFKVTPTEKTADPVAQAMQCLRACQGPEAKTCTDACKAAPGAPAGEVFERLGSCMDGCRGDKALSDDDRATCELQCAQSSRTAGPAQ